jgi:adenine-specific DNA-methyltransferase
MTTKTKLELTWIGKENRPRLEPRILIEEPGKSYHAGHRESDKDIFDNRLIFGDNLLALKALESEFAGKIKCIFIDPPYNTGSAFEHYDDGVEHSLWLSMMRDRLELLRRLLTSDGSIWIVIDDNEAHYLKVICDEIFGRQNFFGSITWQHSVQGKNDAKTISLHHNYVLAYRKTEAFQRNLLARREEHNVNYANPDNDPKGLWRSGDVRSPNLRENLCYTVTTPSGKKILPPAKGWRWSKELFSQKVKTGEITFVNNETRVLRKIYLSEQEGRVPESIWFGEEVGTTREATAELSELLPGVTIFATPKPERLIQRVIQIASNPNDWILDSFAGSGTTGAVAHKMGRKWIMCELGEHCHTHIIPRMQKVIGGKDPGGITEDVEWKGGGGFRYYRLAPSLLERDAFDQWVINKKYNPNMLAEAICKLEGFSYAPSETAYWQHGRSTESDFIYITTQTLTRDQLQRLSDEVGESRTLLVMCGAFRIKNTTEFQNLTLKKIPNAVLRKCEWGRDDYSLEIKELPQKPVEALVVQSKPRSKAERRDQASLFEVSGTDGEAK